MGYGRFWLQGETRPAHVVAWVIENGPVLEGQHVLRMCGRIDCCNPRHMRLGWGNATDDQNLERRFFGKIKVTNIYPYALTTPCWRWTGSMGRQGYGNMRIEGRLRTATHVCWYIYNNAWPQDPLWVRHACDNPWCVNPAHLHLGTAADDAQERVERQRTAKGVKHGSVTKPQSVPRGEKNGTSKLTVPEVVLIRRTCDAYPTLRGLYALLARKFQVGSDVIADIGRRNTWKSIPEDIFPEIVALPPDLVKCGRLKGEKCKHSTISDLTYREIRYLFALCGGRHGAISALARRYAIGITSVERIIRRKDRQDLTDNFDELGYLEPLYPSNGVSTIIREMI